MFIDCADCPLRRSAAFRPMTDAELQFVRHAKVDQLRIAPRTDIITAGETGHAVYTIFSGWAFRYMTLGISRRQIIDLCLPGDLVGLQTPMTGRLTHSVRSITSVSICQLDTPTIQTMFVELPAMSEGLVATLLMQEQRADARLLMLGRQRPTERLSYLLLETRERLMRRGWQSNQRFEFPLTYKHLTDALGLSRSQVASSLKDLRERGWASVSNGEVEIHDAAAMAAGCSYTKLAEPVLRSLI